MNTFASPTGSCLRGHDATWETDTAFGNDLPGNFGGRRLLAVQRKSSRPAQSAERSPHFAPCSRRIGGQPRRQKRRAVRQTSTAARLLEKGTR